MKTLSPPLKRADRRKAKKRITIVNKNNIISMGAAKPILPRPDVAVLNQMQFMGTLIGGDIEFKPGRRDRALEGCIMLPTSSLIIAGSACKVGVHVSDVERLARHAQKNVLFLRYDPKERTEFDFYMILADRWLVSRLALLHGNSLWLVPKGNRSAKSLRLTSWGFSFDHKPPLAGLLMLPQAYHVLGEQLPSEETNHYGN